MNVIAKSKLSILFGAALTASTQAISDVQQTTEIDILTNYMKQHNVTSFVVMDKKMGQILLIKNNKIKASFNALSGETIGDVSDKGMTPAGIFPMTFVNNIPTYQSAIIFNYKPITGKYTAIHPVLDIKGENRLERLQTPTASDNRISHDGCINVHENDLKTIYEFTTQSTKSIRTDGSYYHRAPNGFLVVLPEQTDIKTFFNLADKAPASP